MHSVGSLGMPRSRRDDLVVSPVGDEVLVYDRRRHRIHCLNPTAALVWRHCDGQRTVADLATLEFGGLGRGIGADVVELALTKLEQARLLEEPLGRQARGARYSRQAVLRKAAVVGGAALVPVVLSVVAPTPAYAASCGAPPLVCCATGMACTSGSQCCSKHCFGSGKCK